MAQTQMALDSLDFDATIALAAKVAPHVDILEIGTPCIKHNGIELLKALRAKFPNNKILVDLKTMDAGFYEAEPFYKAGADICTVLGTADIGTIKGVIDAANKYGKEAQIDLINVKDKKARTLEVVKLGAHIIGVHTGLDQQAAGQTPFADLGLVSGLKTGAKVSVAGGVKAATLVPISSLLVQRSTVLLILLLLQQKSPKLHTVLVLVLLKVVTSCCHGLLLQLLQYWYSLCWVKNLKKLRLLQKHQLLKRLPQLLRRLLPKHLLLKKLLQPLKRLLQKLHQRLKKQNNPLLFLINARFKKAVHWAAFLFFTTGFACLPRLAVKCV
jgi:3-hexulose-6-phosphate synthase